MRPAPANRIDFLVIGGGCAGLRAAIELATAGRVLVLTKDRLSESATEYAQGGIAAALSDEDTIGLHLEDTIKAGDELSNEEGVRILVEEGPHYIQELIHWGTKFDRLGSRLAFTREGAHSRSRVLHAHGDSTGREISRVLFAKAQTLSPRVCFQAFAAAVDLLVEDGRVCGVIVFEQKEGRLKRLYARAVLLATGGLGQVYRDTTNPEVATGDGVAMAYRAGAELGDLEFVQFHPTALQARGAPRFLLSESLRGEGAILRNMEFERFMPRYHPEAELAPRDIVARAMVAEMARTRADFVYLDMTHRSVDFLKKRFPRIYATCAEYNLDLATDLVPVHPAAHYAMGGVVTDLGGRTSLAGLYAAGEVASTGLHGANRLASNSLLEGLVFGARAGRAMREEPEFRPQPSADPAPCPELVADAAAQIHQLRDLLWKQAGMIRNGKDLRRAADWLDSRGAPVPGSGLDRSAEAPGAPPSREAFEYRNMLVVGSLIVRSALAREESRGAHYRTDHPFKVETFRKHSFVSANHKVCFR